MIEQALRNIQHANKYLVADKVAGRAPLTWLGDGCTIPDLRFAQLEIVVCVAHVVMHLLALDSRGKLRKCTMTRANRDLEQAAQHGQVFLQSQGRTVVVKKFFVVDKPELSEK